MSTQQRIRSAATSHLGRRGFLQASGGLVIVFSLFGPTGRDGRARDAPAGQRNRVR